MKEPGERRACQNCHMERVASKNDYGAMAGSIASHRWRGANTIVPLLYGEPQQAEAVRQFLQSGVAGVDIFAVTNQSTSVRLAPLQKEGNYIPASPGDTLAAEVIVSADAIAHSFPPEIRDLFESWVEISVRDADGRVLYDSHGLRDDGQLDPSAHAYRQVLLDGDRKPLLRHEVWLAVGKGCDSRVRADLPDLLRFHFAIPPDFRGPLRLRGAVQYRKFSTDYVAYVFRNDPGRHVPVPVITLAEREVAIELKAPSYRLVHNQGTETAQRWSKYGLALLARGERSAVEAFTRASALEPANPEFAMDAVEAELTTQRTASREQHARQALAMLDRAFPAGHLPPRARYWKAVALQAVGESRSAIALLRELAQSFPRDREVHRRLGLALANQEKWDEARVELDAVTGIDPLDADAYEYLIPVAEHLGRTDLARQYGLRYGILSRLADPPVDGACGGSR